MTHSETDMVKIGEDAGILKLSIREAEKDGILQHCAAVYNSENDDLVPDLSIRGPRVVNFDNP